MLRTRAGRRWHPSRPTAALDPGRLVRLGKPGRQPHLPAARVGARPPHPAAVVVGRSTRVARRPRTRRQEVRRAPAPVDEPGGATPAIEMTAWDDERASRPGGPRRLLVPRMKSRAAALDECPFARNGAARNMPT